MRTTNLRTSSKRRKTPHHHRIQTLQPPCLPPCTHTHTSSPQTLFEALANVPATTSPERQSSPVPLHGIIPTPQRARISAAVVSRQAQKAMDMSRRWGNSGKTVSFAKGDHVMLRLPSSLLHGIDHTRLPCIVLEEVRPQYYRLLCQDGIMEGTYRPGDLQPLTGAEFATDVLVMLEQYKKGTKGSVTIGSVVRQITSKPILPLPVMTDIQYQTESDSLAVAEGPVMVLDVSVLKQVKTAQYIATKDFASVIDLPPSTPQ
jgi:hypothetical protein